MTSRLLPAAEALAILLLGLMAGFFFAFAIDVAPAMAKLDAVQYVTAQQWINKVVRNVTFGGAYFGAALWPFMVVAVAFFSGRRRAALGWLLIAIGYFVAVYWLTRSINIPINNELATWNAAAPPGSWLQARDTWNRSNGWRAMASALAFAAAVLLALFRRR